MASKRRQRRKSCEGKKRFTLKEAKAAAYIQLKKYGNRLHVYKCKFCKAYHIGHVNRRKIQGIIDKVKSEKYK